MNAAKNYKTRLTEKSEYVIYVKKAKEFYHTMYQAEKAENWNAVGLNGVHTVISVIDAILVKYSGIRSAEENHMSVVDLMNVSVQEQIKNISQKSQTARRVIAKKNTIAYESRNFLKSEALDLIKKVDRFYQWGLAVLE